MAGRYLVFALALAVLPAAQCDEVRAVPQVLAEKGAESLAEVDTDFDTAKGGGASALLKALLESLHTESKISEIQWVVAVLAFIFGLAALGDGKAFFKSAVILLCAAAGFIFALATFKDNWKDLDKGYTFAVIVSIEIAVAVAYVASKGMEGAKSAVGMTIGFLMFQEAKILCEAYKLQYLGSPLQSCIAGTILVVFGFFLFSEGMETVTFGLLSPIAGAGAVCSSVGYFVMLGISFLPEQTKLNIFKEEPFPATPAFEDYLLMLFTWRSPTIVGFFTAAGLDTAVGTSFTIHWDLWLGRFFLFIIAAMGIYYQWKKSAKARKESKRKAYKGPLADRLIAKKKPAMV